MKRFSISFLFVLASLTWGGLVFSASDVDLGAPEFKSESEMVEVTATVKAIDHKTRQVTLVGPEGNEVTIVVDPQVKNLKKVKKGNLVVVKYYESLSWSLIKPGKKLKPSKETIETTTRAPEGQKPAKVETVETTVIATIEKIDMKAPTVTLRGPERTVTVKVKDPNNLKGVKVGDQVRITYLETLAISVEKAPKK